MMAVWRKIQGFILLLGLALSAWAVPVRESFDGTFPPTDWLTFENGDGSWAWTRSPRIDVSWSYSAYARSESVSGGAATRQWLITPRLAPDASHSTFTFFVRTQYPARNGDDTLFIKLSTSGTAPEDFRTTFAVLKPGTPHDFGYNFTPFSIDLHAYRDSAVYIAFEHVDWGLGDNSIFLDSVSGPEQVIPLTLPENPHPVDQAGQVSVTTTLQWENGPGTQSISLYLSRALAEIENLSPSARVISDSLCTAYTPPANLLSGYSYFWRVVSSNPWEQQVGPVWQFTTGSGGLGGSYLVGDGGTFASIGEALTALAVTGISAPTTIRLPAGVYSGMLTLPPIPGSSESINVTITRADSQAAVTLSSNGSSDTCAVLFNSASYILLDGLTISASGGSARHAVSMGANCRSNTLINCELIGPGPSVPGSDGLHLQGAGTSGNRFDRVTVRRAWRGFHLEGSSSSVGVANTLVSCRTDSVRCGVYLSRQRGSVVEKSDISVNAGASDEIDGIVVATTLPGDTVSLRGNRIHDLATSGVYAVGLRIKPDSASAVIRVYNNFVYGFRNTGSSQIRAVYVSSGRVDLISNSIAVNNVTASGSAYSLYCGAIGSAASLRLLNNIWVNREATSLSYNLFFLSNSVPLVSDYNIFWGTGTLYRMGRWVADCLSLAQWRIAAGMDTHGLEGDPGFISDSDLHLSPGNGLSHQNGYPVDYLWSDIDSESRLVPPDRGADEYRYNAPAADLAVIALAGTWMSVPEQTSMPVPVVVQNRGAAAQSDVLIRLFFNGFQQDQSTVSLSALTCDTVQLMWRTPAAPAGGSLAAQVFLPGDADPLNDTLSIPVQVIHQPMNGVYTIGGGTADFPTISASITDLLERGISGPVVFRIAPALYSEQVTLSAIPGASAVNTITFEAVPGGESPVINSLTGPATIVLTGVRHSQWNGLRIAAAGSNYSGLLIQQNSDSNTVTNCAFAGTSLTATTACGIHTTGGGNDYNLFVNDSLSGFYYGIRLEGSPGNPDNGNHIERCRVVTNRTGIRADYQNNARVLTNSIGTGYAGAATLCRGIHVGLMDPGSVVTIDGNELSGGLGAAGACGIFANGGAGTAVIQNNMLSGWALTGTGSLYGILAGGGTAQVQFNSLWLCDMPMQGNVVGIADTGSMTSLVAWNNVVVSSVAANPVWALQRVSGSLSADFNCLFNFAAQNAGFRAGRSGSTDYPTLSEWTAGTNQDLNSLWGDPGFVDSVNLHIMPQSDLLDNRGAVIAGLDWDFDGDARNDPPDIGADEYDFSTIANDISVAWTDSPPIHVYSQSSYSISVRVSNNGFLAHEAVPIRLFWNNAPVGESLISLRAGVSETVVFRWNTPPAELDSGLLHAQCFLGGDDVTVNDSVAAAITVIGPPLNGHYDVGGGNLDFTAPGDAAVNLQLRGISGPVTLDIHPGTYPGRLLLSETAGAGGTQRIRFLAVSPDRNATVLTASSGPAVVQFSGADYYALEGLSVIAAGTCTSAVDLRAGAWNNLIRGCSILGSDSGSISARGIRIGLDGNSFNTVDSVWISRAFTGIALDGTESPLFNVDNAITNSTIWHARYGITVSRQTNCRITGNDIQPGSQSQMAAACYGIQILPLGSGGSVTADANRLHGFTDLSGSSSNRAVGIFSAPAAGATVTISNNVIYDFRAAGSLKINGLYLSSGDNRVWHNSIRLDDMSGTNEVAGMYLSTTGTHTVRNNIVQSLEDDVPSYGLWQSAGNGLQSDGNDIYGASALFAVGRLGSTVYASLPAWQQAGYDSNGLSVDPRFAGPFDLHISPYATAVNGRGVSGGMILRDMDGQLRGNPPDIGADEYDPQAGLQAISDLRIFSDGDSVRLYWAPVTGADFYRITATASDNSLDSPVIGIINWADTSYVEPVITATGLRFFSVTAIHDSLPPALMHSQRIPDEDR
jgi:hypothetical protein